MCMKMLFVVSLLAFSFTLSTALESENLNNPLLLTPLIENGQTSAAKEKTLVRHEELKDVESYAGYLTVNKLYNSNIFFWYFPSQNDSSNDPLLIWMNGGPGSTSLFGLFAENGPLIITSNQTVELRELSWTKNHNVLYIDNPVGSGFSFTENELGYARNQSDVGRDVLTSLLQFYQIFPELAKNELFVTGESYAGKYVPSVSHAIAQHNLKSANKINLKGLAIGNGFTDPINQMKFCDHIYEIGLLDAREKKQCSLAEREVVRLLLKKHYGKAVSLFDEYFAGFYSAVPVLNAMTGFNFSYNFLQTNEPASVKHFVKWIDKPDVREALHVDKSTFVYISKTVQVYLYDDILRSAVHYIEELLEDHKVLIYSGQLDLAVPFVGTQNFVDKMNWSGAELYGKAVKKFWRVGDDLAGYSKSAGNLNVVMVRNAGHYVPTDQPEWAFDMITRFTRGREF